MPILASSIVEDRVQVDGRRAVREAHTDDLGQVQVVDYLAEPDADVQAVLPIRAAILDALAAERELAANEAEVLA